MTIIVRGAGLNGEGSRLGSRRGQGGGTGLALGILGLGSIMAITLGEQLVAYGNRRVCEDLQFDRSLEIPLEN